MHQVQRKPGPGDVLVVSTASVVCVSADTSDDGSGFEKLYVLKS